MSERKPWYAIALILSLVLAAVGVYRQVDARRGSAGEPVAVAQRPLVPAPVTVSLSALSDRRIAALGGSTLFSVNAAGKSVSEVRLYDGDALIGVRRFDPAEENTVSVQFEWPAVREGVHVLHAEATGEDATEVGHSAPLRLRAVEAVVPARTVTIPGNGRTPAELAAATGVGAGDLVYLGPGGNPIAAPRASRPLADGVVARAPIDRITAVPPKSAEVAGPSQIAVALENCRATVTPAGDGTVSVYELTGGGAGFTLRGTASAKSPYRTDELTPGPHVFVAGKGEHPADSAPISVEAPTSCLADAWSGDATLLDGELTLPKPESRVWVYLGIDGKPFQRVPETGSVPASFGTADLASVMPSLAGSKVRMQVWRPGATAAAPAAMVAESETTLADQASVVDLLGGAPDITLRTSTGANPLELSATATSVTFGWGTQSQIPDGVIWQVLGRPLPATDRNTAPPVLLATGYSADGDGGGVKVGAAKGGIVEIPAELLLAGRPKSGLFESLLKQVPTPEISELVKPGASFGATPLKAPTSGSIPTLDAGIVPIPIGDVYVRVLPVAGTSVVGNASNTVAVTLPPLDPKYATFTKTEVTFDPGRAANWNLAGCIRVTGTPPTKTAAPGSGVSLSPYKQDQTYCYGDFGYSQGGGCSGWCTIAKDVGSLVTFVGKVWDYIASAYNTMVTTLITVIAKFNPFCASASVAAAISKSAYAQEGAEGCEAIGEVVGAVVVSAVLSSFGLPAHLPTSKELADVAEGDLTGLAVAYLDSIGVPCSQMEVDAATVSTIDTAGVEVPAAAKNPQGDVDVCAAMIQQAVGAIRGEVKKAADSEISNSTGLPVPPEPQQMIREPRGQYQGAKVVVTAKPIDPNTPRTARCGVSATGEIRDWKVGNYAAHEPRDIEPGYGNVSYHDFGPFNVGNPWYAELRMAPIQDIVDFETISATVRSSCFAEPVLATFPNVSPRPPLDRWYPGQAE